MIRTFTKIGSGLFPADPDTLAAISTMKHGAILTADFKLKNNPAFHRKLFSLLHYAFEYWVPGEIEVNGKWGKPEKNFTRFRKDLVIMAGYYEMVFRLDGTARAEAKSLNFGSMEQDEREKVYEAILTVVMERIFPQFERVEVVAKADQYWNQLMSYV